jgi:hypothetical protein
MVRLKICENRSVGADDCDAISGTTANR